MSDDLVKLLRRPYGNLTFAEKKEVADCIEELEAKLAKAVEALRVIEDASGFFARDRESSDTETLSYAHETTRRLCSTTLAELTGGKDE